jgi:hypothetical protein
MEPVGTILPLSCWQAGPGLICFLSGTTSAFTVGDRVDFGAHRQIGS